MTMNLKNLGGLLLILFVILTVIKVELYIHIPYLILTIIAIAGFIILGIHHYKNKELKNYI